jgi:hypothetical protein
MTIPASGFAVGCGAGAVLAAVLERAHRLGLLVETHSWKDYPTRVRVTRNSIVRRDGPGVHARRDWQKARRWAAIRRGALAGRDAGRARLRQHRSRSGRFDLSPAMAYTREPSANLRAAFARATSGRVRRSGRSRCATGVTPDGHRHRTQRRLHRAGRRTRRGVSDKLALHGIETRGAWPGGDAGGRDVPASRESTTAAETFEGPRLDGRGRVDDRTASRSPSFALRADRPGEVTPADDAARAAQSRTRSSVGASSTTRSSARNTWKRTWPRTSREDAAGGCVVEGLRSRSGSPKTPPSPRIQRRDSTSSTCAIRQWDERLNLYPIYRVERLP